jgi:hypothetical protein
VLVIFVLSPWSEEAIFQGAEYNGHMETHCLKGRPKNGRKENDLSNATDV